MSNGKMNNWRTFVGFSIMCYLLSSINGEPFNGTDWSTWLADPKYEQQFHNLQLENANLKLRLELLELKMMKQQYHNINIESKLEGIEDRWTKVNEQLSSIISNISAPAIPAEVETNLSPMPDVDKEENRGESFDMSVTLNTLRDMQSTLEKIVNKCSTQPLTDLIKDDQLMLNRIGKEHPLMCIRNMDSKLVCSDVDLPTSCAKCVQKTCRIQNRLLGPHSFIVPCNDTTDGGGWTVIQRRVNDSVNFYRYWLDYKRGFGDLDGNYWIGLDKLHALTTTLAPVELRIELMDFDNVVKYAKYDSFSIGDESTKYTLQKVGVSSGTAGDSLRYNEGSKFTTRDQDNDADSSGNCAHLRRGAWWYATCSFSNFNGQYFNNGTSDTKKGMYWADFRGMTYSFKYVQMMIRPRELQQGGKTNNNV